jgi:DNA-binding transcriptional regulator LsrR (DeoR family)
MTILDMAQHELLAQVASMYYEKDMTQNEIAETLGVSRVKVYRLLRQARDAHVVQINIDWPIKRDASLETALTETFGLQEALILKNGGQPTLRQLGYLGARYLENLLKDRSTLAICLGRSTYEVINAIRPDFQASVQVAQAIGALPQAFAQYDSSALARQLAEKLGGQAMYLNSPLMADTAQAASIIRRQRDVHHALAIARSADIALVGIGILDAHNSGFVRAGFLGSDELQDLTSRGAVGDIAWRIFTETGDLFPCDFNERVIGISLGELGQIPTTIAVASGIDKARAILGALRTGVINVLCTDDETASQVLRLMEKTL